jgi:two-component system, NtrC family, sensor histidine kinase HydH
MFTDVKNRKLWSGVPAWVLIGAVVVLLPIFAFMTLASINRQKEKSIQLLLEKGAALIRSFEAGTRTGMMGMQREGFQLQRLLTETAQQPDIVYLFVTDDKGRIIAHNDLDEIGKFIQTDLDLVKISNSKDLQWRLEQSPDGYRVFEVFRKFTPSQRPMGKMPRQKMRDRGFMPGPRFNDLFPDADQIIFVGLDMTPIEEAHKADIRHAIVMGTILLLIGFAGITLLFLFQSYRATRASLSRIKAFSDTVVENIPVGLIAVDDQLRIAAFNYEAESVLQQSHSRVIGKDAGGILPKEMVAILQDSEIQKGILEREIDCILKDGRVVPLEIGASALEDENGTLLGFVLLFKDLSEVRSMRREIERSRRLASVGQLAAGLAHEIRNPLSSIKGFATYFKERYQDNPEDRQTADIMIQEVDRLNRVVSQLLEFARPVTLAPKPTSLKNLIADSVKLIERQAHAKRITIKTTHSAEIDTVRIDPDRVNQVLLNLYLNAIESMEAGGELGIAVSNNRKTALIEIQVSDTGCGIRKQDLTRIFDPYFTTKSSGTGLGLAIAHNIVEAVGGGIKVRSAPGKGTTFTLILPREEAHRVQAAPKMEPI